MAGNPRPPLAEAIDASLEDLHEDPDPRRGIIRCYRRFERVTASSGVPRRPWDTPAEFLDAVLSRLPVPGRALRALTGLFELARFSDRALGRAERDLAVEALTEIKTLLEQDAHDVPAKQEERDATAP